MCSAGHAEGNPFQGGSENERTQHIQSFLGIFPFESQENYNSQEITVSLQTYFCASVDGLWLLEELRPWSHVYCHFDRRVDNRRLWGEEQQSVNTQTYPGNMWIARLTLFGVDSILFLIHSKGTGGNIVSPLSQTSTRSGGVVPPALRLHTPPITPVARAKFSTGVVDCRTSSWSAALPSVVF